MPAADSDHGAADVVYASGGANDHSTDGKNPSPAYEGEISLDPDPDPSSNGAMSNLDPGSASSASKEERKKREAKAKCQPFIDKWDSAPTPNVNNEPATLNG